MSGRRTRAATLGALATGLAAVLLAAACTDVPTGADVPFSLEFERLPFPAVVAGDLLRDSTGAAAPLGGVAFNVDGEPIADAPIQYLFVGAAARLEDGAFVRGVTAGDTVRITAVAGDVPSLPRLLWVVPRADSLAGPEEAPDTLYWGIPPNPATDVTREPIAVELLARGAGTATPVRSWVVRYRLVVAGDTIAPGDTSLVWLVDDAGRASAIDTTDASGVAGRRVRVNSLNPAIDALESVVVSVSVQGITTPIAGAPVLVTLPVAQR